MSRKSLFLKRIMSVSLTAMLTLAMPISAYADKTSDLQNEIDDLNQEINALNKKKSDAEREKKEAQSGLSGVNGQINSISGAMGDLGEEIEGLNQELVAVLTDIDLIQKDIEDTKQSIEETSQEYDKAVEIQNNQYESMKIRIKYMYEQGDATYLAILIEAANHSMADALNKADYVEQLYTYDRHMLEQYIATVNYTKEVWDKLEEEKSELETSKAEMIEEQAYLEELEAQLQAEYDNYGVMLSQAKQQAALYTAKINQQTNEIKQIEREAKEKERQAEEKRKEKSEEERRQAEEAAAAAAAASGDDSNSYSNSDSNSNSGSSSSSGGSSYSSSGGGSAQGNSIANYALQFVGNPYVAGGTSLTNGADCSGFTMSVYKHFGISIPRTSYAQAGYGRSVSYSEAQPGDIMYYGGHVGIYIGNGQIVHASTERTGIKVSPATYRSIITIRRII